MWFLYNTPRKRKKKKKEREELKSNRESLRFQTQPAWIGIQNLDLDLSLDPGLDLLAQGPPVANTLGVT
jgi:hypothetical protein